MAPKEDILFHVNNNCIHLDKEIIWMNLTKKLTIILIHNNYILCCYQPHQRWFECPERCYQFQQEIFVAFVSPSVCIRKIWLQYKYWEKRGHLPSSIPCPTSSGFSRKKLVQIQEAALLWKESIIAKKNRSQTLLILNTFALIWLQFYE